MVATARAHAPSHADAPAHDAIEERINERYIAEQASVLIPRHGYEPFLLVRTLAVQHQHAAAEVKQGRLDVARAELEALERLHPDAEELALVCRVSADPAWALLAWRDGRLEVAAARIEAALTACETLASRFGHVHLSARRVYLASHLARLRSSAGDQAGARELAERLVAVLAGDTRRWPFTGADTLRPLPVGEERLLLLDQLASLARRGEVRRAR